jgi:hypothetical protein
VLTLLLSLALVRPLAADTSHATAHRPPVTGSYRLRRGRDAGCWLQAAAVGADSVRLQLACSRGAPSYNSGLLAQRLALRSGVAVYATTEFGDRCVIRVRFRDSRALVEQTGTDAACGFGFGVYAGGTYTRTSRRTPPFDLDPSR